METLDRYNSMQEIDFKDLDIIADNAAKSFVQKDKIKTNQVRNVFGEIVKMRTEYSQNKKYEAIRRAMILLKPKLAYAAARQKSMENFKNTFNKLIELVENAEDKNNAVERFFDFTEAIVAYHKYYEENRR